MSTDPNQLDIDVMILADGAQAVGGKLYMLGGGWSSLIVPQLPGRAHAPFSVALGISIPYHLTNRRFGFVLELTDADGQQVGEPFTAEFEQGRPPGLRAGASQSILAAINASPEFPSAGRYTYTASLDGDVRRTVAFEVVPQTQVQPHPTS